MKINLNSPQLSFCHLEQLWTRHHLDARSRVDSQLLHLLAQRIHPNNYILIRCLLYQQQTMLILNDEDFSLFFLSFRTTAMLISSWWQSKSWSPCNYYNTSNSELDMLYNGLIFIWDFFNIFGVSLEVVSFNHRVFEDEEFSPYIGLSLTSLQLRSNCSMSLQLFLNSIKLSMNLGVCCTCKCTAKNLN